MKNVILLIALVLTASCALPRQLQLGGADGPGSKVVSGKEEPATLVAVDGTLCVVTANRFEATKEGDRVWCNWRPRGEG